MFNALFFLPIDFLLFSSLNTFLFPWGFLNFKSCFSLGHFVNVTKSNILLVQVIENTGGFLTDKIDSRFNKRSHVRCYIIGLLDSASGMILALGARQ